MARLGAGILSKGTRQETGSPMRFTEESKWVPNLCRFTPLSTSDMATSVVTLQVDGRGIMNGIRALCAVVIIHLRFQVVFRQHGSKCLLIFPLCLYLLYSQNCVDAYPTFLVVLWSAGLLCSQGNTASLCVFSL